MATLENQNESGVGIVVAHIERYEQLCSEERSFGVEVERAILHIDDLSQTEVTRAEAELETCRMECEAVRKRMQGACEGKEVISNSFDSAPAHTPEANLAAAPAGPGEFILVSLPTSSSPVPSPPSTLSDMDAFSVISDISDEPSIPEEPLNTNPCDKSATHATNNPTNNLTSIVDRGISLCEARRSLQEEIHKSLEDREELYLAAVESAKSSLVKTRREAMDIVTRVKDASGGIVSISLPWQNGVEMEAYSTEEKSPRLAPSRTVRLAEPVPACPATVPSQPVPPIVSLKSTLTPNSFPLAARLTAVVAPTIEPLIPTKPAAITSPHPKPHKHQALLQRYEQSMNAAKRTAALKVPSMPWPVLHSQSPLGVTHPSLSTTTLQSNLQEFIRSYSEWKHSTIKQTSKAMLSDWVLIVGKLKKKNKGAKKMGDRVISHLRTFSK